MTSSLLMLLLLIEVHTVSSVPSCPASCLVCSEEAVICQRLTYIIDAPQTTQALLLNEGSISIVQAAALSHLSNITVLSLSHNRISALEQRSFRNMPVLQTLLLDHNLLTLQVLEKGALTNLSQLQVLSLDNNRIDMINSGVFQGTKSLQILRLEGNQITRLESGSFPLNGLRFLEDLDLSDNLIEYLDKNSFRGLSSLTTLDLSRNRLQSAPSQAFAFLTFLNFLNLDLNSWNCSCQLLDLTAFLSAFTQEPGKTLYNGQRTVCVSADNPTVTTVLELSEANCAPFTPDVSVRADSRGNVSSQLYVRDLAITGAVCFIGGVGLTLLIVLIYYKVSQKKKRRKQQNQEEVKESNDVRTQTDTAERRKDFIGANEGMEAPVGPRSLGNGGHFRCPECRGEEPAPAPVRWERMNGRVETLEDRERQRIRAEDDRRRIGPQHRMMGREAMNRHVVGNSINPERQNRPDLLHCGSCHKMFRPNQMDQNVRQGRFPSRENPAMHGLQQPRPNDWGRNRVFGDFDLGSLKKESRNVTFVLDSPKRSPREDGKDAEGMSPRGQQDRANPRPIKVKLNLNPLRKSKVHPKMKGDEKGSPRKSKDKGSKKDRKKSKKSEQEAVQETVAQVVPPNPMAHLQGFLGGQFRGGGMLLGNRAPNLLGASGPQLATSGLPFQGGHFMAQGKPMFPPSNAMAPNMNMLGPSMGPGGNPAMAAIGAMAGSNSSLAYIAQAIPASVNSAFLQASPASLQANSNVSHAIPTTSQATNRIQANTATSQPNVNVQQEKTVAQASSSTKQVNPTSPTKTSQVSNTAKQTSPALSANSSSQNLQALANSAPSSSSSVAPPDSRTSPKSSPRGQPKTVQEPVPQNSKTKPVTSETPSSPRKGSQTPMATDDSQTVVPQASPARRIVKNMSRTSLTESVHEEAEGVVTQVETPTGELTAVGGTQAADVPVSNIQGSVESGENNVSTALIQQEYLSEDGGSSLRRKLRLVIPEKTTNRPPTALEKKIR